MSDRTRKLVGGWLLAALVTSAMALPAVEAAAADYDVGPIHIGQPWARATPKGASSGAAYLTVTNTGTTPERVRCTASDASEQCQIHTTTTENGVMKMRPVEGSLEIKPGETVTLKPGGDHMMLVGLKHPLEAGDALEATLQFDKAGAVKVAFPIVAIGAAAPGVPAGGGTMMMEGHGGGMMQSTKH